MAIEKWTRSMVQAWEFAVSAVKQGLSGRAGLNEYRAGGGNIRDSSWYGMAREARTLTPSGDFVVRMPEDMDVPLGRYTDVPYKFAREYVVQAQVIAWDKTINAYQSSWVTIEHDNRITRAQLNDLIADVIANKSPWKDETKWTITEANLYRRSMTELEDE